MHMFLEFMYSLISMAVCIELSNKEFELKGCVLEAYTLML